MNERRKAGNAEERKLVEFFRSTEGERAGRDGDHDGLSPADTAIREMRRYNARLSSLPPIEVRDEYTDATDDALAEVRRARELWPNKAGSAHEQYAVLLEEMDELKAHVWMNQKRRNLGEMRKEAIQVAAMAIRFAAEVCGETTGRK